MDTLEFKTLTAKAIAYAKHRGYANIAEDFAQEFLIETLKGRMISLEYVLIDFLRREYGSLRKGGSITGRARSFALLSFHPIRDCEEIDELGRYFAVPQSYVSACRLYDRGRASDEGSSRDDPRLLGRVGMIIDRLLAGDLQQDIAFSLGVTPSRISQLVKPAKEKLEKENMLREHFEEYKLFPEKSILSIDWIAF